jgi:hypothetical protein
MKNKMPIMKPVNYFKGFNISRTRGSLDLKCLKNRAVIYLKIKYAPTWNR